MTQAKTPQAVTGKRTKDDEKQEAARKRLAARRKFFAGLLVVLGALNGVLGYQLYQSMILDKQAENLQTLSSTMAEERQQDLAQFIKQQQKQIAALGDDFLLKQTLINQDQALRETSEKGLEERLNAIKVRIIPLGTAVKTDEQPVPIRFSELDLIRRAETGEMPWPEAIQIDKKWAIHWIVPLKKDQEILGTVMLTLDAQPLFKRFRSFDPTIGQFQLQQQFTASPVQVMNQLGEGATGVSGTSKIPNSYWSIQFTASDSLKNSVGEPLTLWLLVMIASALLCLFISIALSRLYYLSLLRKQTGHQPSLQEIVSLSKQSVTEASPNPMFQTKDVLDVQIIDEDQKILGIDESTGKQTSMGQMPALDAASIPAHIFRSYDIRGIVGNEITIDLAFKIGTAIGSEALDQGEKSVVVARDARTHSEELTRALVKGILRTGCHVINIGVVPTPLMYFATFHFNDTNSGVMVTASHNPKIYNGFKVVMQNHALSDAGIQEIRERIISQRLHQGVGEEIYREIIPDYIERIFSDVAIAGQISIVVDAGNAVTGIVAPQLFEELGCKVIPLFCELDGNFPNHEPDPTVEKNLQALIAKVKETNADIGVAFDGDGDRLVVVTPRGDILWPDRLLMLFAKDVLQRNPGADILFDVKCSRLLNQVISGYGGRPIMWKTGHSPMKAKMEETRALIGGEYSGHIFIKDRWYGFDDGIYAMARLLEIITLRDQKIDAIFAAFPTQVSTPEIRIAITESEKFSVMETIVSQAKFPDGVISTIDGLRVDFEKSWGLVRASNTSPALTFRFEAETQELLDKIKQQFKQEIQRIHPQLKLNF